MPYAVIVPGFSDVYGTWAEVQDVIALYPYPKFRKFSTTEECWEYVRRHTHKRVYSDLDRYGDTFKRHHVQMEYFIQPDKVYYNFKTKKIGRLALETDNENLTIINSSDCIKAILKETYLNDDLITGHVIAIWNGLQILGEYVDVDVRVPDHSIFYTLMTYKGNNRTINLLREYMDNRLANVSVSMEDF